MVQYVVDRVIYVWRCVVGCFLSMEVFFKIICDYMVDIINKQIDCQFYRVKLYLKLKLIIREDIEVVGIFEGFKDIYKVFFFYLWCFMEIIVRVKQR